MFTKKRLSGLLLIFALLLTLTTPVFAAEGEHTQHTITILNTEPGHTYTAYQIFKGDLDVEENKKTLTNVKWGDDVKVDALPDELKAYKENPQLLADKLTYDTLPRFLAEIENNRNSALRNGKDSVPTEEGGKVLNYKISPLSDGYYLVIDTAPNGAVTSRHLLELVENSEVYPKTVNVTFEKKVQDKDDSEGTATDWQDSADYDIGDSIPFQLQTKLSYLGNGVNGVNDYKKPYKLVFHDTMSKGLTYDGDMSVAVMKKGGDVPITVAKGSYNLEGKTDGFVLTIPDVGDMREPNTNKVISVAEGDLITATFHATLNPDAVIGSKGNTNTAYLEYSNNPYVEQEPPARTPDDQVTVFTFKIQVNKVEKDSSKQDNPNATKPLKGAEFKISKWVNNATGGAWEKCNFTVEPNADTTTFMVNGIDAGRYKIEETKTPTGYNGIAPIFFKVEATHEENATEPKLKTLTVTVTDEKGDKIESKTEFTVSFNTGDVATDGLISTDVLNEKGSALPETGGVGTTIFYVLGSALVLAAVVLLVSKKRMSAETGEIPD